MSLFFITKQHHYVSRRLLKIYSIVVLTILVFSFSVKSMAVNSMAVNSMPAKSDNPLTGLWIEAKKHKIAVWVEECDTQLCGRIYWLKNPLSKNGTLKIRGYVGISLFGKTLKWERPKEDLLPCDRNVITILNKDKHHNWR